MFDTSACSSEVSALVAEAERAAGRPESLRTRAEGYLGLYKVSKGACVFALIAAHGAIWASWYLVCAKIAAVFFAVLDPTGPYRPLHRYQCFAAYVMALKEINRTVMIATHVIIHGIQRHGIERMIVEGFPADLVEDYAAAMQTRKSTEFLRDLYHRHFLWEQDRVVSGTLETAFDAFDWPFMRGICQKPWVWFSYFRVGRSMNFRKFTDQAERVEKGLIAFDRAAAIDFSVLSRKTERRIADLSRLLGSPKP